MTHSNGHLQQINELINACFVSQLKEDVDEVTPERENFDGYRKALEMQLPLLFDLLQQNKNSIFECKDQEGNEILANLLVLLCEISAPNTVYRTANESLQRNVKRILKEQMPVDKIAIKFLVLSLYQEKIGKTAWKKQIGALHGFLQFLHEQFSKKALPKQWINFCLSVSLTVRDSHEPFCKRIGILLFNLILNSSDFLSVQQQNIHSVIYDSAFKDVDFVDSEEAATDIWECLYKCLDYFKELDSFNWSRLDDLMEKALKTVTMAPNDLISLCNMQYIRKCASYFAINKQEIEVHCNANLNNPMELKRCRITCATNNSYIIYRWAKNILNMFIDNSYKLMHDKAISMQFLTPINKRQKCKAR
ncbi:uncharacterized protein [Eurosta solidaginis]|uniref:uncharacterized protein isoform X2 n=1 Tax=Eurosta solidaginis TaxID=178769 RepID=UPI0035313733